MEDLRGEQIGDELDFEGSEAFALIATAREDFGQVVGQGLDRTIVGQDTTEGLEQAAEAVLGLG